MTTYINTLIDQLSLKHPEDQNKLKALQHLMIEMTDPDPAKRPSMDQVVQQYKAAIKS